MIGYTDKHKRQFMRMLFDDEAEQFCAELISILRLDKKYKTLLTSRYVEHKSDKEIARDLGLSPYYVNKQMNVALKESYEALKHIPNSAFETTK